MRRQHLFSFLFIALLAFGCASQRTTTETAATNRPTPPVATPSQVEAPTPQAEAPTTNSDRAPRPTPPVAAPTAEATPPTPPATPTTPVSENAPRPTPPVAAPARTAQADASLVGTWAFSMVNEDTGQEFTGTIMIKDDQSIMTVIEADIYETPVMNEERMVNGNNVKWSGTLQGVGFSMVGTVEGNMLNGTMEADGFGEFELTAERS